MMIICEDELQKLQKLEQTSHEGAYAENTACSSYSVFISRRE